jgi:hypothetical protein
LLDERVPETGVLGRDEALLQLVRRYFSTRGPATMHDFAWWSGLPMDDVRRGIEIAAGSLEKFAAKDRTYWLDVSAPRPGRSFASAHLLPNYDEYFIGFRDRSAIGERLRRSGMAMSAGTLGQYVVVVNGELVGVWRHTIEKRRVIVQLELLTALKPAERKRIDAAVERFGSFLDRPAELEQVRRVRAER